MEKNKKNLTPEDIYKRNQKVAKVCKILSPIVFWLCIALAILTFYLAIRNSFGNIAEIVALLDKENLTGAELEANYNYLIEKWGEWTIGGAKGGFQITFVNIKAALVNPALITNGVLCVLFIVCAFVLGRWFLPKLANDINTRNTDMVNLTVLRNNSKDEK